jgi:predicted ester cyclase
MRLLSIITALALSISGPARAAAVSDTEAVAMAEPHELVVGPDLSLAGRDALLKPVDAFYGFWENGSPALLAEALSPDFVDHTLPPGRPQGPSGPQLASNSFLAAIPDLSMTVTQRLVVGDRVVSHLRFTGHFTGTFQGVKGEGQPVDFIATDILRVRDGRITDNWHLEDNLTFLKQVGIVITK